MTILYLLQLGNKEKLFFVPIMFEIFSFKINTIRHRTQAYYFHFAKIFEIN